ncbi:MAG TPA: TatD family hydrolase, partial [Patescibacteria group bacterium]|nr:TatD family hydrolase [Patescibacteria group bacterium]
MIDVHCHLNFHSFKNDYDEVIKSALTKGITRIINTGTQLDSSQWAVDLAHQYSELFAIVGIHPHHADKIELGANWLEELETIAKQDKVVGIGEIGLDYFSYKSNGITDPKLQKEVFDAQIQLAHKLKLPIQIHNRLAGEDVIALLKERKHLLQPIPGMFHCFAGSQEVLKSALEMGFFVGFDGNSTYPGLAPKETVELSELIKLTPLERIVTETDSPYLTPIPHRGERNLPEYVLLVGQHIAKVKGLSFEQVVEQTT